MANWASVSRLGDPSQAAWQQQNLAWIEPVPGQRWQVYKPAAQAFEGLLRDLAATGYPLKSSGGFNYRTIRGGNTLSQHAFGTAIDLNAATNPMLKRGQAVVTDLPSNIGELAAKHGLEWGGNWSRPDAMHFEWRGGSTPTAPAAPVARPSGPAPMQPGPTGMPQPPQNLASLFAPGTGPMPMAPIDPLTGPVQAPQGFGGLALMFAQQQARRQGERKAEEEAEQMRRAALFSADSLAGLYS